MNVIVNICPTFSGLRQSWPLCIRWKAEECFQWLRDHLVRWIGWKLAMSPLFQSDVNLLHFFPLFFLSWVIGTPIKIILPYLWSQKLVTNYLYCIIHHEKYSNKQLRCISFCYMCFWLYCITFYQLEKKIIAVPGKCKTNMWPAPVLCATSWQ